MPTADQIIFTRARLDLVKAAAEAAGLPGLSPVEREQMRAIAGIAALQLHHVVGDADQDDGRAFAADLLAIAKPVDKLVEAIGTTAQSEFSATIDISLFREQLRGALEGNATFEVEEAGRESDQDRYDNDEAPGSARAREAMGA